jgi:hypothetical protein
LAIAASNARKIDATSIEACFRSPFSVIFTFNAALNEVASRRSFHAEGAKGMLDRD